MPYSRQRPRVAPTERISVRLTTGQRDLFIQAAEIPRELAYALRRASVHMGKLSIGITRGSLDALITIAVKSPAPDRRTERALTALLRYLESLEGRFAEPHTPE